MFWLKPSFPCFLPSNKYDNQRFTFWVPWELEKGNGTRGIYALANRSLQYKRQCVFRIKTVKNLNVISCVTFSYEFLLSLRAMIPPLMEISPWNWFADQIKWCVSSAFSADSNHLKNEFETPMLSSLYKGHCKLAPHAFLPSLIILFLSIIPDN
jgi:hypothetical protein